MKSRAAVAWEAGKALEIELIDLEGPKEGEVLLRNVATGVCHTDAFTLSGEDPEGLFPAVLGHEGGAIDSLMKQGLQIFGLQKSKLTALCTPHLVLVACYLSRNFFKLAPCRLQLGAEFLCG